MAADSPPVSKSRTTIFSAFTGNGTLVNSVGTANKKTHNPVSQIPNHTKVTHRALFFVRERVMMTAKGDSFGARARMREAGPTHRSSSPDGG